MEGEGRDCSVLNRSILSNITGAACCISCCSAAGCRLQASWYKSVASLQFYPDDPVLLTPLFLQKMLQTPRTVEEVASLVEITVDRRLEDSIKSTTWASSFYDSLQDEEMKLLFVFLVLCCSLQSKDKKTQDLAVFELQNRVFSNCRTGIANIR